MVGFSTSRLLSVFQLQIVVSTYTEVTMFKERHIYYLPYNNPVRQASVIPILQVGEAEA